MNISDNNNDSPRPEAGPGAIPDAAAVFKDPVMLLAFGFGSGLSPVAPGTVGSVAALALYFLLLQGLSPLFYLGVVLLATVVGVYLCGAASKKMGVHDHGGIVWDEFAGLWLALYAAPAGIWWPLLGFVLFRFFDVLKPFPISWLDKNLDGGLGIMVDDIIAGSFAFVCLQLLHLWFA
jgi:phosphatidylglycerophosphatase A